MFQDVDAKLLRADTLLKNNDLAGVNAVTRMRQQNRDLFAKRVSCLFDDLFY